MSLEESRMVAGMEQADADANLQYAISLLHPFLVKLLLSNPITKKKLGNQKKDFSQSLQAIIEDWKMFYPAGSKFAAFQKYFSRAKQVRHLVAHQSFDRNRYQHYMESLASVATAIEKPELNEVILNLGVVKDVENEESEENVTKEEKNKVNISSTKKDKASLKEEGDQLYKEEHWNEATNCYTRAIHLNQQDAVLYSNRALCELRLSKLDLAREDIEDAIQLDPKNVKYFRVLSEVLQQMKLHEESLAACLQGLDIDPRDDVLNIRERDCRALIASDLTEKIPTFVPTLGATYEENQDKLEKMLDRYKNLPLTSEDIEKCSNVDRVIKLSQISKSIGEARQLALGQMTSSTKKNLEGKALDIFKAAAKKGSADGLYNMAVYYSLGKGGLPMDFYKAIELCRKAADQKAFIQFKEKILPNVGVADAESFLGICYRDGRGVDKSSTKAFEWYLRGSKHDNPIAQNNLGLLLLNGDGCKKNETFARYWFQKAAEQGLSVGQYNYAMVLEEGLGGPIDVKTAGELLKLSADQGNAEALERLQKLSMSGALGGSNMEETKENLKKGGEKGDPLSLFLLGQNYQNGTGGFKKDLHQAELHLREASKAGYADAYLPLGKLLLELKKNEDAFEFIKLSAEKGSAEGQFELGTLFAYGHGCTRDEAKARRWLNRAKQQGLSLKLNEKKSAIEDWVEKVIDCGKEMSNFETHQQLKPEGMTLQERKKRLISSRFDERHPATSTVLELLELFPPGGPPLTPRMRSMRGITPECMNELLSRAENGSATALSFFKACEILDDAMDIFEQKGRINDAFKLIRLSLREFDLPILEFSPFYMKCIKAAKEALDRNSKNADALYVVARLDSTQSNEEKLRMAKRCVELDSSIPDFHHLVACMCGFVGDDKNALRAVDRALELLPTQVGWLYCRSSFIRRGGKGKFSHADTIEALLKFLSSIPTDHRFYPDACYFLAHSHFLSGDKTQAKAYYQKGLDAEDPRIRLPCFEPVKDDLPAKKTMRLLLKACEGFGKMASSVAVATAPKETTNNCANCFKSDQSFRCTACKSVWYCDRACQVANWKKHKVDCKRVERP